MTVFGEDRDPLISQIPRLLMVATSNYMDLVVSTNPGFESRSFNTLSVAKTLNRFIFPTWMEHMIQATLHFCNRTDKKQGTNFLSVACILFHSMRQQFDMYIPVYLYTISEENERIISWNYSMFTQSYNNVKEKSCLSWGSSHKMFYINVVLQCP